MWLWIFHASYLSFHFTIIFHFQYQSGQFWDVPKNFLSIFQLLRKLFPCQEVRMSSYGLEKIAGVILKTFLLAFYDLF